MSLRGWWLRAGTLLVVWAGLLVVLTVFDFEPRPVETSLLVLAAFAAGWLVMDTVSPDGADWGGPAEAAVPPGRDRRLATYIRIITDQLTAREADAALTGRLLELARGDAVREDPVLADLQDSPARRLTLSEIDDILRRIEHP